MLRELIEYSEPVFRPPSEARSFILQVTHGCSWNRCTFCEMYTDPGKKFTTVSEEKLEEQLKKVSPYHDHIQRVFIADGDAMVLSTTKLLKRLELIRQYLPKVRRVGSYCLPQNLKKKSVEELIQLKEAGLGILYVGAESGDDEVLKKVQKSESYESTKEACLKIKQAGIRLSVMILNGLGGSKLSQQHAKQSALLMNDAQPDFLSTLVVSFPKGEARFRSSFPEFEMCNQQELFQEMHTLINTLELERTVFRSDHASNYLVLKGTLGRDKDMLLKQINSAIASPENSGLRQEWQRGL